MHPSDNLHPLIFNHPVHFANHPTILKSHFLQNVTVQANFLPILTIIIYLLIISKTQKTPRIRPYEA